MAVIQPNSLLPGQNTPRQSWHANASVSRCERHHHRCHMEPTSRCKLGCNSQMTQQAMMQMPDRNNMLTRAAICVPAANANERLPTNPLSGRCGRSSGTWTHTGNSHETMCCFNGVTAANYNTQVSYPGAVNPASFQGVPCQGGAMNMTAPVRQRAQRAG
jgi:hypothetical protein